MIAGSHPSNGRCNHRLLEGGGSPKAGSAGLGPRPTRPPGLLGRLGHLSISIANPRVLERFFKICNFSFSKLQTESVLVSFQANSVVLFS